MARTKTATATATPETDSARNTLAEIPLAKISASTLNPRKYFDEGALAELAESIKSVGLIEPIAVRTKPDSPNEYELIVGERRLRACKLAGLKKVPARDLGSIEDSQALQLALIENLHREDLDAIEEAEGYAQLNRVCGMKQVDIGAAVGRSQAAIANAMRLLELPESVRAKIQAREISSAHGRAMVRYAGYPALCERIAEVTIEEGYTSKELEAGFQGYDGMRPYLIGGDILTDVAWGLLEKAKAAGLTIWDGRYTPDVETYRHLVAQWQQEEKDALEGKMQAARAAAQTARTNPTTGLTPENEADVAYVQEAAGGPVTMPEASAATEPSALALPRLSDLPYGTYELVDNRGTYGQPWPKACGPDCECRAKAVDRDGKVVDISTRPRHISALRAKEQKAERQLVKQEALSVAERLQVALDTAPALDNRSLAVAAAHVLTARVGFTYASPATDIVNELLARYTPNPPERLAYDSVSREALDALAEASPENLVRLMAELLLRNDIQHSIKNEQSASRQVRWFLNEEDAKPESQVIHTHDDEIADKLADNLDLEPQVARARLTAVLRDWEILDPDDTPTDEGLIELSADLMAQDDIDDDVIALVEVWVAAIDEAVEVPA